MSVEVVAYRQEWGSAFAAVSEDLREALVRIPSATVEHVGSTSVPGLAAKPIIDIDVIVPRCEIGPTIAALESIGYTHLGDLGVTGREAMRAPDEDPPRHVYVCEVGTLAVRNHLAVRDVLRTRADLRLEYGAVKARLAADPEITIAGYIAGKSEVLQRVLAASSLVSEQERIQIAQLNGAPPQPP